MLKFLYLILSYNMYIVVSQSEEAENSTSPKTTDVSEATEAPNNVTVEDETPSSENKTEAADDGERELKHQDWDVWCKLQPNGHDCSGSGRFSTRYYYDTLLEDCKTFPYGQCKNSYNNFATMSECHDGCREAGIHPLKIKANYTDKIICRLQPSFGFGYEYHPSFYYDINQRKCRGFSYSGMGGNRNRFPNSQVCSVTCLKLMDPELTF